MNFGIWIVLAMVFVMIGGLVGYVVATIAESLVWAIASGITSGLLAVGVVVWVSNREGLSSEPQRAPSGHWCEQEECQSRWPA